MSRWIFVYVYVAHYRAITQLKLSIPVSIVGHGGTRSSKIFDSKSINRYLLQYTPIGKRSHYRYDTRTLSTSSLQVLFRVWFTLQHEQNEQRANIINRKHHQGQRCATHQDKHARLVIKILFVRIKRRFFSILL